MGRRGPYAWTAFPGHGGHGEGDQGAWSTPDIGLRAWKTGERPTLIAGIKVRGERRKVDLGLRELLARCIYIRPPRDTKDAEEGAGISGEHEKTGPGLGRSGNPIDSSTP